MAAFTGARTGALGTATGSFTLPGGNTASDTFSVLLRPSIGYKIV
jgi:hypothetical protein